MSEIIIFSAKGKLVCKPFEVNSIDNIQDESIPIEDDIEDEESVKPIKPIIPVPFPIKPVVKKE